MPGFLRRRDDLERRLRRERPQPRAELVRLLTQRLQPGRSAGRPNRARLGLAAAVSAATVVSLGAFGGLGYAASSVGDVVHVAKVVVVPVRHAKHATPRRTKAPRAHARPHATKPAKTSVAPTSHTRRKSFTSAAAQYGSMVELCHNGHVITVGQEVEKAHLAHGDTVGKCKAGAFKPPSGTKGVVATSRPKSTG